jgi:hypothetical protein
MIRDLGVDVNLLPNRKWEIEKAASSWWRLWRARVRKEVFDASLTHANSQLSVCEEQSAETRS